MPRENDLNRRDLLKAAAAAGLAGGLNLRAGQVSAAPAARQSDAIRAENERPGTRDWLLTNVRIDPKSKHRSPGIEGYASRTSVRPGESLSLFVSTNPTSPFVIDVYRLGYYQGHGARHVERLGPFQGTIQPDPPVGEMRLRECVWEPTTTLTIPKDWTSGVYLGKLTAERDGLQSYIIFIVRDDRQTDVLFQCSDTTWGAYNRWPDNYSLYRDGKKQSGSYWGPEVRASLDRPYGKFCYPTIADGTLSVGSGEFLLWEFPIAFWLEQHGYDVSYISNIDTHADAAGLRRGKSLISVGHDEYWSLEMFDNVKAAIADGLNVAFLSGNTVCAVTDLLPSTAGQANRVLQRVGRFGSPERIEMDNGFPEEALFTKNGPNENTLMGARSVYPTVGAADWICRRPDHWLFAKTGMKEGDGIRGLVGWEFHGDPAKIPGLEIVAGGETSGPRGPGQYTATLYPGPKGNLVFNASTIWWGTALSAPPGYMLPKYPPAKDYERPATLVDPQGRDPRVEQITHNLLERFLG